MSSVAESIGNVASFLSSHADLIGLLADAVRTQGIDHDRLREAIKSEMTRASDALVRAELDAAHKRVGL